MNNYGQDYWFNVIQIALKNNLSRIKRCCTIMGRENSVIFANPFFLKDPSRCVWLP